MENKNDSSLTFVKYYFAGVQPTEAIIDEFVEELIKNPKIGQIFGDEICQKYPRKFQYEKKLLKMILNK
uniref:Uncharacterized protein n=1 Tax=Panagrolaimus sp. JU765 TaxID=591449 RepID=A0AC34PWP4_9BILA